MQCFTSSFMVGRVAESLYMHIHSGQPSDPSVLSDLCFALARGIDHAVANNEVPPKVQDLPVLVKQVYKHINDCSPQAAVMALMISIKNACMIGWFQIEDAVDLLIMAEETGKTFSNTEDVNIEPSYALSSISKIISRFYPRVKMGHILASLEVKAGYRTIVSDFHILKSMVVSMQNQIGLFVAQMDNMDTSSCITTPPQANFLLNGKGVRGRNNVSMDTGPQLPTNITAMLKYGINLFQVVGQFNGNYHIVIAFMSVMSSSSETPVLQDYVQPVVASLNSDYGIIEGPSRVSLNCPISRKRIKTPVKGHLCKHYQCFDYENFMEMNSRRPSWRCPHCNQSVCYPDIRISQDIAKILREVGENVVDVKISADGSWKVVLENEDHTEQTGHETQSCQQERPQQGDFNGFSCVPAEVVDLTVGGDNAGNAIRRSESMARQHFQDNPPCFSVSGNLVRTEVNVSDRVEQNGSTQIEEHTCSRIPLSLSTDPYVSVGGTSTWAGHATAGIPQLSSCNLAPSPVLTDDVSSLLYWQFVHVNRNNVPLSSLQSQLLGPSNLQSRQFGFGSSITSDEYGRLPSIATNVGGTSASTQGFTAQAQVSSSFGQRTLDSLTHSGASAANYPSTPFMVPNMSRYYDRGHQLLRPLVNSLPVSDMASSSMQNHSFTQNRDVYMHHYISGQTLQQAASFPSQGLGAHHISSGHQNPRQCSGLRMTSPMTQSQNIVHQSIHVQPVQFQQGSGGGQAMHNVNNTQTQPRAASPPMAQMLRTAPHLPIQLQPSRTGSSLSLSMAAEQLRRNSEQRGRVDETTQPVLHAEGSATLASTENWRPSGRMRGSLTGEAYDVALRQFMLQSTQRAQVSGTSSELMSTPHGPLQMQGLVSSSTNAQSNPQAQTHLRPPGGATNWSGSWIA